MKNFTDVANKSLELSETISEGLKYAGSQSEKMEFESALHMLDDILFAVESIEAALMPVLPELSGNQVEDFTCEVKGYLGDARQLYEDNNTIRFQEFVRYSIFSSFQKWQDELRRVLAPYTVS